MLDVFLTADVEVWCDGWDDLYRKFPSAFSRYVYGDTRQGRFGLPYQIELLQRHGLPGVFFVEPMFSTRFGIEPLREIVGLLNDGQQEVQLHLHTEWVDEARDPIFPGVRRKRQYIRDFSLAEQTALIGLGLRLMERAGAAGINAFRAGSFGMNRETLDAVAANGLAFDSSYNASTTGRESGVATGTTLVEPMRINGVCEYPMTVFHDGFRLRHTQLTACSASEFEGLLWSALAAERKAFVVLSHNFELLNRRLDRPDWIVIRRFEWLCEFLARNRDCFRVRGFRDLAPDQAAVQPQALTSPRGRTLMRMGAQVLRRIANL